MSPLASLLRSFFRRRLRCCRRLFSRCRQITCAPFPCSLNAMAVNLFSVLSAFTVVKSLHRPARPQSAIPDSCFCVPGPPPLNCSSLVSEERVPPPSRSQADKLLSTRYSLLIPPNCSSLVSEERVPPPSRRIKPSASITPSQVPGIRSSSFFSRNEPLISYPKPSQLLLPVFTKSSHLFIMIRFVRPYNNDPTNHR